MLVQKAGFTVRNKFSGIAWFVCAMRTRRIRDPGSSTFRSGSSNCSPPGWTPSAWWRVSRRCWGTGGRRWRRPWMGRRHQLGGLPEAHQGPPLICLVTKLHSSSDQSIPYHNPRQAMPCFSPGGLKCLCDGASER